MTTSRIAHLCLVLRLGSMARHTHHRIVAITLGGFSALFMAGCGQPEGRDVSLPYGPGQPVPADCLENPVPVTYVIDGDTIEVTVDGRTERVRLRGIDTPEIHPQPEGSPPQACAERAKVYTDSTLGSHVDLVFDSECASDPFTLCRDDTPSHRLLAYVRGGHCEDHGERLVRQGLARVFRDSDFDLREAYEAAEAVAQDNEAGIWGDLCAAP